MYCMNKILTGGPSGPTPYRQTHYGHVVNKVHSMKYLGCDGEGGRKSYSRLLLGVQASQVRPEG